MLTVLMPCYNEADLIEDCVREWHNEVVARIPGAELLVVDDCSMDSCGAILDRLSRQLPGVRSIRTPENRGHGRALRYGFRHISSQWVFQTDSDRQHKPDEFWRLWELRENCDFVFGVRTGRADGMIRIAITMAMRLLIFAFWGVWIRDANCPFKLMRSSALTPVLSHIPEDSFIPMVMVSIVARTMGFRVTEAMVTHLPRRGGTQSLKGILRWFGVARTCALQLWRLRRLSP